ncbi:MAG TPA: response regulator transcription factor [Chloroflexota bacterium]|nr:response regulator transcription factor [Chloroflexota bacterium]HUM69110.1 response regulator transcription factor [Chloroflexota bacterium]
MPDVLVVEDDAFTRSGICRYLHALGYQPREAGDVQTAWELALAAPPPTAVIDIRLPLTAAGNGLPPTKANGIDLTLRLKKSFPTLGVVLLSAHHEYEREVIQMAQRFMRSIAFLHKGGDMFRLEWALQEVQNGRTLFQSDLVNKTVLETAVRTHFTAAESDWIDQALDELPHLSPRELEIAHSLAAAYTPEAIAARLSLSKGNVDNVISHIYVKLGLAEMKEEGVGLRPLPILVKACLLADIRQSR